MAYHDPYGEADEHFYNRTYANPYDSQDHYYQRRNAQPSRYKYQKTSTKRSQARAARKPVAEQIAAPGRKTIKINLSQLTWAAYTPDGALVKSGPVSGGRDYCPDIKRGCRTPTGTYTVYRKQGPECKSSKFPVGKGGAKMPYCMHFNKGYAMHGSNSVPGYNASHGCVRMLVEDARWLNQEFVNVGSTKVHISN